MLKFRCEKFVKNKLNFLKIAKNLKKNEKN